MAPKANINPAKATAVLKYFQTSGVAHSIKDLEKSLPSAASISSMAVKDYLSHLTDENQVRIEKIGSINWWWSFAGEEKLKKERAIAKLAVDKERASNAIAETRNLLEAAKAAADEEEHSAADRVELSQRIGEIEAEISGLKVELESYRESDPKEMEQARGEIARLKENTDKWTDAILEMERYLEVTLAVDRESLMGIKRELYGAEFDEEENGLKEL